VVSEQFAFHGLVSDLQPLTVWGPLYQNLFVPFIVFCVFLSIAYPATAYVGVREKNEEQAKMLRYSLGGTILGSAMALFFWFFAPQIPALAGYMWVTRFAPLFLIGANAYAILKFGMFDIKIATFELFSAFITIVLFVQFAMSETLTNMYINGTIFALVFFFVVVLNRNIKEEGIRTRKLQTLSAKIHEANAQLKSKDVIKSHFLGFVSHQVAVPMAVIREYAAKLENVESLSGEEIKNMSGKIVNTTDEAVHLVNNILLLRKMEEGSLEYFMQEFSLTQLLRETMIEFSMFSSDRHIGIVENIDETPIFIWGDQTRIRQVLQNVLENALRFTNEGGVVEVTLSQKDAFVVCAIKDSGIGMAPETLQSLFTQFVSVFNTGMLETGRGMGLYVSAQVVIAHNGRLWAESAGLQKGSTFYIRLPYVEQHRTA
jgi:signal transduction histidine kinase